MARSIADCPGGHEATGSYFGWVGLIEYFRRPTPPTHDLISKFQVGLSSIGTGNILPLYGDNLS